MLCQDLTLPELRRRVEEAERMLRVACQLARDELGDPEHAGRARERICAITREVQSLFVGLNAPEPPLDPVEMTPPSLRDDPRAPAIAEQGEEDDDEELEIDYEKLSAALENDALMGQLPEQDRAWFKSMAGRLVEANERRMLGERVLHAYDELTSIMDEGLEETKRLLTMALTFDELRKKTLD
jgi:hypothetical protein